MRPVIVRLVTQRSDHALLILVMLSILSMVIFWRRAESHLLGGAIAGITLYNVTNGTRTGFRYAMPGLAFYAVFAGLLISQVDLRWERSPVRETPTDASQRSLSLRS